MPDNAYAPLPKTSSSPAPASARPAPRPAPVASRIQANVLKSETFGTHTKLTLSYDPTANIGPAGTGHVVGVAGSDFTLTPLDKLMAGRVIAWTAHAVEGDLSGKKAIINDGQTSVPKGVVYANIQKREQQPDGQTVVITIDAGTSSGIKRTSVGRVVGAKGLTFSPENLTSGTCQATIKETIDELDKHTTVAFTPK